MKGTMKGKALTIGSEEGRLSVKNEKKRREKEKEKKGKDLRKKREEGIRAGTRAGHFPSFFSLFYTYGEIRENGPFMIILHPTNNLITRI